MSQSPLEIVRATEVNTPYVITSIFSGGCDNLIAWIKIYNFEFALAHASMLWNSTFSPAISMSPSEYFYFHNIRTNGFISYTQLIPENRQHLTNNISKILQIMSHIRLEKRRLILERRKIWNEHKDTLLPGQYIFILQDRVKKAGWKLRQIYDKDLYFILRVSKTYLFCIL